MKENIEQMRERHQREVVNLQENCKHTDLSGWTPYMWAPGHMSGNVKCCKFCGKIIETDQKPFDTQQWRKSTT
jgi:hypothetical protein